MMTANMLQSHEANQSHLFKLTPSTQISSEMPSTDKWCCDWQGRQIIQYHPSHPENMAFWFLPMDGWCILGIWAHDVQTTGQNFAPFGNPKTSASFCFGIWNQTLVHLSVWYSLFRQMRSHKSHTSGVLVIWTNKESKTKQWKHTT